MRLFQIYKMELYKMVKRKTSWILLIPSILAIVVSLAVSAGGLKISAADGAKVQTFSCMDYTMFIWGFLSQLGIIGILFILVAAFQFSAEVERGQIKMLLLRVGKRSYIILGKFIAMITAFIMTILTLIMVTITSYYIFIAGSKFGNGEFALSASGFTGKGLILSILCTIVTFIFLTGITYCTGSRVNMMVTFVIALVLMYVGKYLAGLKSLKFMKFTSFYMENEFLISRHISHFQIAVFVIVTLILISMLIKISIVLFRNTDIK